MTQPHLIALRRSNGKVLNPNMAIALLPIRLAILAQNQFEGNDVHQNPQSSTQGQPPKSNQDGYPLAVRPPDSSRLKRRPDGRTLSMDNFVKPKTAFSRGLSSCKSRLSNPSGCLKGPTKTRI